MTWEMVLDFLTPGGVPVGAVPVGAGVLALGVLAGVMPLRGGSGQHADPGPGALNVWQLCVSLDSDQTVVDHDVAGSERIAWPAEDPDAWLAWLDEMLPQRRPGSERLLEPFELCDAPQYEQPLSGSRQREPEYVGRHRLVNPLEHLRLDIVFQPP